MNPAYLGFLSHKKEAIFISEILKVAFSVAGSVIGAGFATGKELQLFFPLSDNRSLLCLSSSILLMLLVSLMYFGKQKKTLFPALFQFSELFFLLFSGASCLVMFACGGETLKESFRLPLAIGNTLTCLFTLLIVSRGIGSVYRFNLFATPVMMLCIIVISTTGLTLPVGLFPHTSKPVFNLLIYSGYNLLSVLPFLSAISEDTKKKVGMLGTTLGFILVLLCGLLLKLLLNFHHQAVFDAPIPMLKIVGMIHPMLSYLYTVMLLLSVLTTAVNALYAVTRGKHTVTVGLFLLTASFFGFTTLIEHLYPLFGYLGIGIICLIVWDGYFQKGIRERRIK